MAPIATSLRAALAEQSWLEAWQPTIAATPDWALLAAVPTGLLLLWLVVRLALPRRGKSARAKVEIRKNEPRSEAHAPAAAPSKQQASSPTPPVVETPAPIASNTARESDHGDSDRTGSEPRSNQADAAPDAETAATSNPNSDDAQGEFLRRLRDPDLHKADEAMMAAAGALSGVAGVERKKDAIKFYEIAVSHDPALSHAWCQLGGLYGQEGRYDASKHAFEKAL